MPILEQRENTIYHYYDQYENCYFFFTWQDAWRFYQKLKMEYVFNQLIKNRN